MRINLYASMYGIQIDVYISGSDNGYQEKMLKQNALKSKKVNFLHFKNTQS